MAPPVSANGTSSVSSALGKADKVQGKLIDRVAAIGQQLLELHSDAFIVPVGTLSQATEEMQDCLARCEEILRRISPPLEVRSPSGSAG